MFKLIQNIAIAIFIISTAILTFVAIMAIWDVFEKDVLYKSLSTIGVVAFASLVVIVAGRFIDKHKDSDGSSGDNTTSPNTPNSPTY